MPDKIIRHLQHHPSLYVRTTPNPSDTIPSTRKSSVKRMPSEHEHTLNVWTAELLRDLHGIDAKQEQKQADRRRIDIEVRIGPVKIALEAEQGQTTAKKREAISDADNRLKQKNADCAIAVCYPDGISHKAQIPECRMLWTIRAPDSQVPLNFP